MALNFDAGVNADPTANSSTLSWNHTVAAGAHRKLLIGIAGSSDNPPTGAIAPTVDAVAATLLDRGTLADGKAVEVWQYDVPGTAQATVAISFARGANMQFSAAGSMSFVADAAITASAAVTNSGTANPSTGTIQVASGTGQIPVAFIMFNDRSGREMIGDAGQTERISDNIASLPGDSAPWLKAATKTGAATVDFSWANTSGNQAWFIIGTSLSEGGGDETAPTLSNATASSTGSTTASGSVDTDEAGTVYAVITESATPPGDGDDIVGESVAGGVAYDSAVASEAGTVNLAFTGLDPATTYWMHVVATDAVPNMSDIESSSSFETDAASVTTLEADPFTAGASFTDATFERVTQADPMAVTASFSDVTFSIDPGGFTLDAEPMSVSASFVDAALNYDGAGFAHTLTADPFAVAALFADATLRQVVTNSAQATRASVSISIGL